MDAKKLSSKEVARLLLQLIHTSEYSALIDDAEYIGQGIHKLYLDHDTLARIAGLEGE
jgi:hypothetical protein